MEPVEGAGAPIRLLPDGRTVVSFCPGDGTVSWFDLDRLTITKRITVPHQNPFWVSPAFSRDGSTLLLHEAGSGRIEVVDLQKRATVHSSTLSASTSFNPFGWLADRLFLPAYAGGIPRTVVLSPDGTRAYAVMGDLWSVALPSLHVLSRKAVPDGAASIWLSGDENTIYALNNGGSELSVLHRDGTPVATIPLATPAYDFLNF
jgi:DNA-binding beta-propeller fold protein YncE